MRMHARRWTTIAVMVPPPHQDLLAGTLALLGMDGFLQLEDRLECSLPSRRWTSSFKRSFGQQLHRFEEQFPGLRLPYSVRTVREENWNRRWQAQAGIVEATPRIIIKPSWKTLRKKDRGKVVLHIDPKMAFGTGHHETTRLCLLLIEDFVAKGQSVLDFGCGTGVLAIACVKLGARRAVAVDNDAWAIPNARENLRRNAVQRKVRVIQGSLNAVPAGRFDVIVANIDAPTIGRFLPSLRRRLGPGGVILLSGILETDLGAVQGRASACRLAAVKLIKEHEWVAVAYAGVK